MSESEDTTNSTNNSRMEDNTDSSSHSANQDDRDKQAKREEKARREQSIPMQQKIEPSTESSESSHHVVERTKSSDSKEDLYGSAAQGSVTVVRARRRMLTKKGNDDKQDEKKAIMESKPIAVAAAATKNSNEREDVMERLKRKERVSRARARQHAYGSARSTSGSSDDMNSKEGDAEIEDMDDDKKPAAGTTGERASAKMPDPEDEMERLKRVERLNRARARQQDDGDSNPTAISSDHMKLREDDVINNDMTDVTRGANETLADFKTSPDQEMEMSNQASAKPGAYHYVPSNTYYDDSESMMEFGLGDSAWMSEKKLLSKGKSGRYSDPSAFMVVAEVVDDSKEEQMTRDLESAQAELNKLKYNMAEAVAAEVIVETEPNCFGGNKRKWSIIACIAMVAIVGAIVAGVVLGTAKEDNVADIVFSATASPTIARFFTSNDELIDAVQDYLHNGRKNTDVASRYGWPIGNWDVSRVTDFTRVCADERFNEDIGNWNVSSGTDFSSMFEGAKSFNHDISMWDVSNGIVFKGMFYGAKAFNQDIGKWQVSRGTIFNYMFSQCSSFNQDLKSWDVANGKAFEGMFDSATVFDSELDWNVSNGIKFTVMFKNAAAFNRDISGWNVENGENFVDMFHGATSFNQNLCPWGSKMLGRQIYYTNMFTQTSCPDQSTFVADAPQAGPLCHACS